MRRWAFPIVSVASLLILSAGITAWLRSELAHDIFRRTDVYSDTTSKQFNVEFSRGALQISSETTGLGTPVPRPHGSHRSHITLKPPQDLYASAFPSRFCTVSLLGLKLWSVNGVAQGADITFKGYTLMIPLWLSLPFAIPPLLWLRRVRKSRGRGFPVGDAAISQQEVPPTAGTAS